MKDNEYIVSPEEFDRLRHNINGVTFTIPPGLTRSQKRRYIIDCANGKIQPDPVKKTSTMIYQMIVKALKELEASGTDIGYAVKYCSENAFTLVALYEQGTKLNELVSICIENK
jgi:hypothetical protein